MCLDTITKENLNKSGVGYKVFTLRGGGLYGQMFAPGRQRKINRWENEKKFRSRRSESTYGKSHYPYGFHIFKSWRDATQWVGLCGSYAGDIVIKVKYRKGHTLGHSLGKQEKFNTIVAKKMLILPNQLKES